MLPLIYHENKLLYEYLNEISYINDEYSNLIIIKDEKTLDANLSIRDCGITIEETLFLKKKSSDKNESPNKQNESPSKQNEKVNLNLNVSLFILKLMIKCFIQHT